MPGKKYSPRETKKGVQLKRNLSFDVCVKNAGQVLERITTNDTHTQLFCQCQGPV